MCKVITISNCKGGTGKTTSAINLGIGLARKGFRVLLADLDAQGSMTAGLGIENPDKLKYTMATALTDLIYEKCNDPRKGIIKNEEGVDLMPGNVELAILEANLVNTVSRETVLREFLCFLKPDYDFIILDCPPSLGQITLNAFAAADSVLIPVQAAYLPVKGMELFIKEINRLKGRLNPLLDIEGILMTMVDGRTNYTKEMMKLLNRFYEKEVRIFKSSIPFSVRAAEATHKKMSIFSYDPKGKVAEAYRGLAEEVLDV